jgi:hypothetical protein
LKKILRPSLVVTVSIIGFVLMFAPPGYMKHRHPHG